MEIYNSALKRYHKDISVDLINQFSIKNCIAFCHDINKGMHEHFESCDIIYSEPFWKNGHDTLYKKNMIKYSFSELQERINYEINVFQKPTILVVGKNALKHYSNYSIIGTVILHNYPSQVIAWNCDLNIPVKNKRGFMFNNYDLMDLIVEKYSCIGDFMCGFGNLPLKAFNKNKSFVASDIDTKCISVLNNRIKNK